LVYKGGFGNMAQYQDDPISSQSWLHELARAEVYPEADRLLNLQSSLDPHQLVEESTIEFLTELRKAFSEYARLFNSYSDDGNRFQPIKIYSLAGTAADFMIFRNQVKLMVSNSSHGLIQFRFARHVHTSVMIDGQSHNKDQDEFGEAEQLTAEMGPFRRIFWTFQAEKVEPIEVAKFYFAEFVRTTRDMQSSRQNNQILLQQIKSFLQEKGLDL
jgi:hypothetical protein